MALRDRRHCDATSTAGSRHHRLECRRPNGQRHVPSELWRGDLLVNSNAAHPFGNAVLGSPATMAGRERFERFVNAAHDDVNQAGRDGKVTTDNVSLFTILDYV